MIDVDYNVLSYKIQEVIDESIIDRYDIDSILRTVKIVWDNTAVEVSSKDFIMIFDLINYNLLDYTGLDA